MVAKQRYGIYGFISTKTWRWRCVYSKPLGLDISISLVFKFFVGHPLKAVVISYAISRISSTTPFGSSYKASGACIPTSKKSVNSALRLN